MIASLELPNSTLVGRRDAAELAGDLHLNPAYLDFEQGHLEDLVHQIGDELRTASFAVGDATLVYISRAGARPSDRARAVEELASKTGVIRSELWRCLRTARAFPYDEREEHTGQTQSWFEVITDRTGLPGDTPEQRRQRQRDYAERCADMNAHQARQLIDSELRPSPDKTRWDHLETSEAPHPVETEPPPVIAPRTAEGGKPAEERFAKQLVAAYREWQPGTGPMVAEMVLDVLRRGGWVLTGGPQ
jgi:hypothetical protein